MRYFATGCCLAIALLLSHEKGGALSLSTQRSSHTRWNNGVSKFKRPLSESNIQAIESILTTQPKLRDDYIRSQTGSVGLERQIFCNVELNGATIEAVGFDMDFTLAQYNEAFDLLAFEGAKKKLVDALGYPREVLDFKYESTAFRRGLIIDNKLGNVIKLDRHKYPRKVYHGLTELNQAERRETYGNNVYSFSESNYVNIDTLFGLVDAVLFGYLVDMRDRTPEAVKHKSYDQIYKDIRNCVDLCHRDGVIKDTVRKNPSKYIIYDEAIVPMLRGLKKSGKKVFLLTNSLYEYTQVVMEYLVHAGGEHADIEWQSLFDVVIVGACKPGFMTDDYLAMFQVNKDGSLKNIEDKDSLKMSLGDGTEKRVFQGGHWKDLHRMLDIRSGDRILYVGDHMYADVLRSKRSLGWRTCLIIPELEHEIQVSRAEKDKAYEVLRLRRLQYELDEHLDYLRGQALQGDEQMQGLIDEAEEKAMLLKQGIKNSTDEYNAKFNRMWGQLFKAGHSDSRFAKQVTDYACLYTSRASNLGSVSPVRVFRLSADFMPHDVLLMDSMKECYDEE